jgi:8-oxoguanine DNA-glycosylase Ogg
MRFTPPDGVLNLAQTLDCGQSFRFYPVTLENNIPAWRGVAFSRGLTVYQDENNDLVLDCTEQEFRDIWFDYFDFNTDYKKSREVLSALHPALKEAAEFAGGIRILKQEPFEALCSFIISQNNNIPRIKGIIERLCLHFGEPFLYHNEARYAFPTPKKLASCTPEDLAPLRAGFRAKYLIDAAKRIASGEIDLEAVRKMPLPDAKAKLQTISGVGPKVADCALLYGLHRTECFPMDVWMKRAVSLLPGLSPAAFSENAGIAQQKLFTDITPEEWQRMLDVNLSGAFHLCQLALPGMIRRKQGRILTVSSMWGQTGGSCEVHYSAAKAGLIGLTKALAKEEGPSGITVNCVAPGVIETDMMAAFTAEDKAALAEETPVGRLGTPEEVAKLLVFLAGEDAGYITGQVFGVNGGLVI